MLLLSNIEETNVNRLLEEWGYFHKRALSDVEECCCGTKSYYYEVIPSGIGDHVYLVYDGHRALVSDLESL